ncbi:MAG: hypothetical protein GEU91_06820 [Rhizobiales bacterium]|nr:hypothetical protein [Hyphomicrobiales bacterium]
MIASLRATAPAVSPAPAEEQGPIRVLVVDDAVVVRGLVSRWLNAGLCSAVLPIEQIASAILRLFPGDRS